MDNIIIPISDLNPSYSKEVIIKKYKLKYHCFVSKSIPGKCIICKEENLRGLVLCIHHLKNPTEHSFRVCNRCLKEEENRNLETLRILVNFEMI